MTLANYGKGVIFWESDAEAKRFVNEFQDVTSQDTYWFTDPNICGASEGGALLRSDGKPLTEAQCRRASNYGQSVERIRGLMDPQRAKPVWTFVEVGHPASEPEAPTITGPQIRAAVWSSLIHGARGIVYFNHSFGGDCGSQHILRDKCGAAVRPEVTRLNAQIARLAPVLNAPFVDGLATSSQGVDVAAKFYGGDIYLLAGSTSNQKQIGSISLSCIKAGKVDVIDENRSILIEEGKLVDSFDDGNSIHLYRLDGSVGCGLT